MKRFFFGGVHPPYQKEMSLGSDNLVSVTPKTVTIPLRQHIGAPCLPLVCVGERVVCGQKIGDGDGLCVPVHASVSGTVVAIEERPHPAGGLCAAIVIENDFEDRLADANVPEEPLDTLDADAVLHRIREAGIVGMGGAAFPGNIKALSAMGNIDTLLANACECEPYITSDDMLLRTKAEQVLEGMMILVRLLSPKRAVIAIEDNKCAAIARLQALLGAYPQIELAILPTRYPQGAEKQLIRAVTGREVPPLGLPAHVGCVVFNVSTYKAILHAVKFGTPLIRRIVTVTGEGVNHPQNLLVPIGTSFEDLIEIAGGLRAQPIRVLSGGPMMGVAQNDLAVPVVKATNAVLCLEKDPPQPIAPCVRCGKCLSVCPMHLQPLYICRYAKEGNVEQLMRLHVVDCMECGCCSFTCPSKLPLVDDCRTGKKLVKEAASK